MFSDVVDEINEAFVDSIDSKLKGGGQLLLSHIMRSGADTWDDRIRMVGRERIDGHGCHHLAR